MSQLKAGMSKFVFDWRKVRYAKIWNQQGVTSYMTQKEKLHCRLRDFGFTLKNRPKALTNKMYLSKSAQSRT